MRRFYPIPTRIAVVCANLPDAVDRLATITRDPADDIKNALAFSCATDERLRDRILRAFEALSAEPDVVVLVEQYDRICAPYEDRLGAAIVAKAWRKAHLTEEWRAAVAAETSPSARRRLMRLSKTATDPGPYHTAKRMRWWFTCEPAWRNAHKTGEWPNV